MVFNPNMQITEIQKFKAQNINNNKAISFSGSSINWTKAGSLLTEELDIIKSIRKDFDVASTVYIKLNDMYQTEFKKLYPDIFDTKKLRGFTFHVPNGDGLQIQKVNNMKGNDELLTFSVIRAKDGSKLHYKVNNSGDYYVSNKQECIDKIPQSKLESLKKIESEMSLLRRYAQNFIPIRKKIVRAKGEPLSAKQLLAKIEDAESFNGFKQETQSLIDKFNRVNKLLYKNQSQAAHLKEEFFSSYVHKAKGWTFAADDGSDITICPSLMKWTDAQFSVTKTDKSGGKKVFLFFTDGKIASPVELENRKTFDFRSYNLEFLTSKEIEENKLGETLKFLDKKIDEFEHFILVKRGKTPEMVEQRKSQAQAIKKQKAKERMQRFKQAHSSDNAEIQKPKGKRGRPKKIVSEQVKEETIIQEAAKPKQIQSTVQPQKAVKPKREKIVSVENKYNIYKQMQLENVIADLDNIFRTPASERSSHLIHEKFPNGRIFEGRFQINASDGSKVMVSRVKASNFYDFTYYALRVTEKDGTLHVMNIDPSRMKIIDSVNGKPVTDKYGRMNFLTPLGFLRKNPWAINVPKYLEEITAVAPEGQRKFLSIAKRSKSQAELLEEAEKEVMRALRRYEADDTFLY